MADFFEFFLSGKNRKVCDFLGLDTFKKIKKYQTTNREQDKLKNEIMVEIDMVKKLLDKPKNDDNITELRLKIYDKISKNLSNNKSNTNKMIDFIIFQNEIQRMIDTGSNKTYYQKERFNKIIRKIPKDLFEYVLNNIDKESEFDNIHDKFESYKSKDLNAFVEFLYIKEYLNLLRSVKLYNKSSIYQLKEELEKIKSPEALKNIDSFLDDLICKGKIEIKEKEYIDPYISKCISDIYDDYRKCTYGDLFYDKLIGDIIFLNKIENNMFPEPKEYQDRFLSEKSYTEKSGLSRAEKLEKLWAELLKITSFGTLNLVSHYYNELKKSYETATTVKAEAKKITQKPDFTISEKHRLQYSGLLDGDMELVKSIVNFPGNMSELFLKLNKVDEKLKSKVIEVFKHAKKYYKVNFDPEIEEKLSRSLDELNGNVEMLKKILREIKTTNKSKFFIENGTKPDLMQAIIEVWNYFWYLPNKDLVDMLMLLGEKNIPEIYTITQKPASAKAIL